MLSQNRATPRIALSALLLTFSAALIAAGAFKYARWGQGFDMVDFHMPIWGTLHGRFLLVSRYNFTDTFMGLDVALGFLPAIPFYAIAPSAYTLVAVQVLMLASAAIPVYLIAARRLGSGWAGVAFAAVYLLYPTTQFMAMAGPFQPRVPALVLFLWAFFFLERGSLWPYLATLFVAMLARTDAALVVVAFGMVAALRRARWPFAVWPALVGLIYFYVALTYITPLFYAAGFHPAKVAVPFDLGRDYNDMWPCGLSPQACYYLHLGGSLTEIAKNIVTHPVQIFFFVFQPAKLQYLALMLGALLFLPALAPRELLLAAPIFAINLLSNRVYQYVITEQYQILAIPGLIIAAIYGAAWALRRWEGLREGFTLPEIPPLWALGTLALIVGLLNIPLKNPAVSAFRNPETAARVAVMERMRAEIPPDATVAATSFLAPHLLPRTLYYIPGGKMHHQIDEAAYAFIDTRASAIQGAGIVETLRADPRWQIVDEQDDLVLFHKVGAP
ncbi:MAG: DUF2079 domain-containing protein [Chloroflexales bacterium]